MAHQPLAPWGGTKGWYKAMAFMIQPYRDPKTGVWKVRKVIPKELKKFLDGRTQIKISLRTKDAKVAKLRAPAAIAEIMRQFAQAELERDQELGESKLMPDSLEPFVINWLIIERGRLFLPEILARYTLETPDGLEAATERFSDPLEELKRWYDPNYEEIEDRFLSHMQLFIDEALAQSSQMLVTKTPRLYIAKRIAEEAIKLCNSAVDNQGLLRREAVRFGNLETSIQSSQAISQSLTDMGLTAIDADVSPQANASSNDQISKNSTVSQLIEWVHSQKKIELGDDLANWIVERNKACSRASEYFGNKPIGDIRKLDIRMLLELVTQCPRLPKMKVRSLPMKKQIEIANAENLARVSLQTANKEIKLLSGYFQLAVKLDLIPNNPCHGVCIAVPIKVKLRVPEYTTSEINAIFSLPLFREIPAKIKARYGEAPYWLPVILAYTGARAEEIAQLYIDDIEQDAEKPEEWYFHIRAARPDQSVKRN